MDVVIGEKGSGKPYSLNLSKMSAILVAGEAGRGKSQLIETILLGLIEHFNSDDLKLCLMNAKKAELETYANSPYLMAPIAQSIDESASLLALVDQEMRQRYYTFSLCGSKNFEDYQKKGYPSLPNIVVVFEEFSGSQMLQPLIVFLAQIAKAAGIYIILTTQMKQMPIEHFVNTHITVLEGRMFEVKVGHKRDLVRMFEPEGMEQNV